MRGSAFHDGFLESLSGGGFELMPHVWSRKLGEVVGRIRRIEDQREIDQQRPVHVLFGVILRPNDIHHFRFGQSQKNALQSREKLEARLPLQLRLPMMYYDELEEVGGHAAAR